LLPLTSWEAQDNTNMVEVRTLKKYANPSTEEPRAIIVYPTIEGDKFKIKPALLNLVQPNQFFLEPPTTGKTLSIHSKRWGISL